MKKDKLRGCIVTSKNAKDVLVKPAFAAVKDGQVLWPAIVEKAYAKVHGSYDSLSGGFISEALYDLSGAPTERIPFHNGFGRRIDDQVCTHCTCNGFLVLWIWREN